MTKNSPSRARTYDLAVNSRSLYLLSYRGTYPSKDIIGTAPDAPAIIVEDMIHTTDFGNFVKIYLRRSIEKKLGPCWTCATPPITLLGLCLLRLCPRPAATPTGGACRCSWSCVIVESEEHGWTRAHLGVLQSVPLILGFIG